MFRYVIYALPIILGVYALVDCISTNASRIKGLPKFGWILLILFVPLIGPVAWLFAGRDRGEGRGPLAWLRGESPPSRGTSNPLPPDDDPEFLRRLAKDDRAHEQMLQQWERELRRREKDSRDGDGDETGKPAK